jgi:hypothetical protein
MSATFQLIHQQASQTETQACTQWEKQKKTKKKSYLALYFKHLLCLVNSRRAQPVRILEKLCNPNHVLFALQLLI